jgi:integrase
VLDHHLLVRLALAGGRHPKRLIQAYLGHSSPKTTALYTHLTREADALATDAINRVMQPLL